MYLLSYKKNRRIFSNAPVKRLYGKILVEISELVKSNLYNMQMGPVGVVQPRSQDLNDSECK